MEGERERGENWRERALNTFLAFCVCGTQHHLWNGRSGCVVGRQEFWTNGERQIETIVDSGNSG